jgi:DNA repair protein RadC
MTSDEENGKLTIKSWAESDRPREKMMEKGAAALSDAELIAILVGSGIKNMTAVDLAKMLLNNVENDLNKLGKMSIRDFCKIKGIGMARAVTIAAALELGRRRKEADKSDKEIIRQPADIYNAFVSLLLDLPYEEFWMMYLNRRNQVVSKVKISQGGTDKTPVDIKFIAKSAIDCLASSAVAVHNHPSGNLEPSAEDISLTMKIKSALTFFDIRLLDHLIISDKGFYSFADNAKL